MCGRAVARDLFFCALTLTDRLFGDSLFRFCEVPCKTDCLKFVTVQRDSVSEVSAPTIRLTLVTQQHKSSNLYISWTLLENPEGLSYFCSLSIRPRDCKYNPEALQHFIWNQFMSFLSFF